MIGLAAGEILRLAYPDYFYWTENSDQSSVILTSSEAYGPIEVLDFISESFNIFREEDDYGFWGLYQRGKQLVTAR